MSTLSAFRTKTESAEAFLERFDIFCSANEIKAELRLSHLLTALHPTTYGKIRTLLWPKKPSDCDTDQIRRLITLVAESEWQEQKPDSDLMSRPRHSKENFVDYAVHLKDGVPKWGRTGDTIDSVVLRQFLRGLREESLRIPLNAWFNDHKDATLVEILEYIKTIRET